MRAAAAGASRTASRAATRPKSCVFCGGAKWCSAPTARAGRRSTQPGRASGRSLFFINREHRNYAGKLPLETVIKALVSARGQLGTPAEYLLETVRGLIEHGVRDSYLLELRKRVLAAHPELAASHAR